MLEPKKVIQTIVGPPRITLENTSVFTKVGWQKKSELGFDLRIKSALGLCRKTHENKRVKYSQNYLLSLDLTSEYP